MPEEIEDSLEVREKKETTADTATDTETDNKLYVDINKDIKNLDIYQSICESSEGAQNASTEQQPNASDYLPYAETKPHLDSRSGNAAGRKPSTKLMQQRQEIKAGIVSAALLLVVVSCALKIHVKVVVFVGTVGLAWIGLALYNTLKPNTKLEKVEDVKQTNCSVSFESDITQNI
jgi:hypothetical protein